MRTRVKNRFIRSVAAGLTALLGATLLVGIGATSASASANYPSSRIYLDQTFYAYVGAGETLDVTFSQTTPSSSPVTITISDPTTAGVPCVVPGGSANGIMCAATGLSSTTAGVWTIQFDPTSDNQRYSYDIQVRDATSAPLTGRIWTDRYNQYQSGASTQSLWVVTREGYTYRMQLINFNGVGSAFRANGFGLVEEGTCTPIYRSANGTSIAANGVALEAGVEFSESCGDDYWMFFEQPDAALPPTAPSVGGQMWVRPAVIAPAATDLAFVASSATTRAGEITFDLSGVNGGYSIQIDANADGDYSDAVDRTIPWGSPPGAVTVPFDGLDGVGDPIGVCQAFNARVVVDRVGEMHFVLEDVEQLGNGAQTAGGIRLTGETIGVTAPPPLLYWDDTVFPASTLAPPEPWPSPDGSAGVDSLASATNGVHGWRYDWGNTRSIENWTYYQATAGSQVAIDAPCDPSLSIDKRAELDDTDSDGRADVDETIQYSFLVRNTGNAALTGVTVNDPRVTGITPATVDLPVGAEQLFTAAPYTVTQADVDAGGIPNTAIAHGTDPLGGDVESAPDSEFVPTPDRAPALTIDKQADLNDEVVGDDLAELDETITYSFVVRNTGNTTLTDVSVIDPHVTGVTPTSVTLAPGAQQVFIAAPYVVTQDDMNSGVVANIAHAEGTSPTGDITSPPDETQVPTLPPNPFLELDKTGVLLIDADTDGQVSVGDTVRYTFEVTNTGTVDVDDVVIDDPRIVGSTTPAIADIPANATLNFIADYVVVQADIDAGVLRNTATARGTFSGTPVTTGPDTVELPTQPRAPSLELEKTGVLNDSDGDGFADAGETVQYGFRVENTGNTTLANVTVIDARLTGIQAPAGPLAPGQVVNLTADLYTVTQADVDAGGVANVAVARGNVPGGPEVTSPPDDYFIDGPPPAADIELDKRASLVDTNGNGYADAGEQIVYSFFVTNTGNVTLFDVSISDDRIGTLVPAPLDLLPPGVTAEMVASAYTVTSSDASDGPIVNTASARGMLPDGTTVIESDDDSASVPTPPAPGLASTGADPGLPTALGMLALLLGLLALGAARAFRRRRA
jgi:uncharacterized repeat protein (TIGR01451 family)